jgi:hypothetical protein
LPEARDNRSRLRMSYRRAAQSPPPSRRYGAGAPSPPPAHRYAAGRNNQQEDEAENGFMR